MNKRELVVELRTKLKETDKLSKEIIDTYKRTNKCLQDVNNGLEGALSLILDFTSYDNTAGSDLECIRRLVLEGLDTYRKVYAKKGLEK